MRIAKAKGVPFSVLATRIKIGKRELANNRLTVLHGLGEEMGRRTISRMTNQQRQALILEYLRSSENGGRTSSGGSLLDLFAEDAQVGFPKWGLAVGREQIGRLFAQVGGEMLSIHHHFESFMFTFSGSDTVVVEGTSEGLHKNGPWNTDMPHWGAGRFCDVFEIRDFLIHRCFVYLDPDYAGQDAGRYPWLGSD